MINAFPKKIQRAIEKGELVPHELVFGRYSKRDQKEIMERARYTKAALELKKLRRELHLSQDELARRMSVKREFISRIESGRQNFTLETLYRIAEVAGKEVRLRFR